MNSVERVIAICKERKIPISKLEKDLGFGNGYISQLRKGMFPADRLEKISKYLNISTEYILTGEEKSSDSKTIPDISPARQALLDCVNGLDESQIQKMIEIIESAKKLV